MRRALFFMAAVALLFLLSSCVYICHYHFWNDSSYLVQVQTYDLTLPPGTDRGQDVYWDHGPTKFDYTPADLVKWEENGDKHDKNIIFSDR